MLTITKHAVRRKQKFVVLLCRFVLTRPWWMDSRVCLDRNAAKRVLYVRERRYWARGHADDAVVAEWVVMCHLYRAVLHLVYLPLCRNFLKRVLDRGFLCLVTMSKSS